MSLNSKLTWLKAQFALLSAMLGGFAEDNLPQSFAFFQANRAQMTGPRKAVGLVVALMVAAIVAAFLLPIAIDELVAVDTSSWSSGASSLWDILDVIVVLALFLFMIGVAVSASDRV